MNNNAFFELIAYVIVIFIVFLLIYYKIFLNDSFQKKIGKTLFYETKSGHKLCTDYTRIFLYAVLYSSMIFALGYALAHAFDNILFLEFGCAIQILFIYFGILLYVRKKYFPFLDEEKDMRKRPIFIKEFSEENPNSLIKDYINLIIGITARQNLILGVLLVGCTYNHHYLLPISFLMFFVISHVILIPDYINKNFGIDLRKDDNLNKYLKCLSFVTIILVILIGYCVLNVDFTQVRFRFHH